MIRLDVEKLLHSLCKAEDRGCHDDNPVFNYLHKLVVLNSIENKSPKVTEIDFEAFTQADLEEYHEIAIDAVENIFPKVEQLVKDIDIIKACQATSITYF